MNTVLYYLPALALSYIINSIPTGYLIARWCGIADIRNHGSGNIGATNVARILGARYFFLVFLIDFFKCYSVLAVSIWWYDMPSIIGLVTLGALLGNAYPLFLHFRGGKSVATSFGALGLLHPHLLLAAIISWATLYVSCSVAAAASVITFLLIPIFAWFLVHSSSYYTVWLVSGFVLWRHKNNIQDFVRFAKQRMQA